jgi:transposase
MAATHVHHIQEALDQMNLQLHHVISDITGQTGLAIVDAIKRLSSWAVWLPADSP